MTAMLRRQEKRGPARRARGRRLVSMIVVSVKKHWLSPLMRRVALREWLIMVAAMLLLALGLGSQNGLGRLDQTLYDKFVSSNGRPARDDIIIIAIDDFSLAQLGRWPWRRSLHAELIDRLSQAHPRVIGMDVILSESERSPADGERAVDGGPCKQRDECGHQNHHHAA